MQEQFGHFTVTSPGKDRENKEMFSLDLNDDSDRDDVTSGGR